MLITLRAEKVNWPNICTNQFKAPTSPPGKHWAYDHHLCLGSGEFDHCPGGVGNLNQKCQVQLQVLLLWMVWV